MPVASDAMTVRARALAAAIKRVREAAGVPGRTLSLQLGLSHGTVSHWETGRRIPTPEDVAALLGALRVVGKEKDTILQLARRAAEPNWLTAGMPGIPQQLAGAVECERSATAIVNWSPAIVPGLLQTADYARALGTASGLSTGEVEARVMLRMGRREILTRRNDPVALHALVGEAAVREPIASDEIMAEQLRHLAEQAERPNVTVQIIPSGIGWHPGLLGPFIVYDFADAPSVVHFEHFSSGAFVMEIDDVEAYRQAVARMRDVALDPAATMEVITKLAEQREGAP